MSQELCRRLRQDARSSHHGRSAHEAATLIEQQAARIAVLEQQAWCGGTEAKTVRATRDEPLSPACAPCKAPGGTCFPEPCGRYQQRRAEAAEAEVKRLCELLNTPELLDFQKALVLEAAHQRERWGDEHDKKKSTNDWIALVIYLTGKVLAAHWERNTEKYLHHIVTLGAVAANWHSRTVEALAPQEPRHD